MKQEEGAIIAPQPPKPIALPVFDAHHPPSTALLSECVHCGFCLNTCPTYRLWGKEADSPRGRIYLMQLGLDGEAPLDAGYVGHFDRCLGCMACLTSCPSGVEYDKLIEATRAQIERRFARSLSERLFRRLIFSTFPHPNRLRLIAIALWLYQHSGLKSLRSLLPARVRAMENLLPPVSLRNCFSKTKIPLHLPSYPTTPSGISPLTPSPGTLGEGRGEGSSAPRKPLDKENQTLTLSLSKSIGRGDQKITQPRPRVGMLLGCVQQIFFGDVNEATIRVLAAEGCEVVLPPAQCCCGALMTHAGEEAMAIQFARRTIDAFESANVDLIAINSAGCGSATKEYGYLLRDDPQYAARARAFAAKCRDISEILAGLPPLASRHPLPFTVAYHDACHLQHAQRITSQPRSLLQSIPELKIVEIEDPSICCGSAGIYNLLQPQAAAELGKWKAQNVLKTGAAAVVSGNPGCTLQIRGSLESLGNTLPVLHWVQLLDASIHGTNIGHPGLRRS